MRSYNVTNTHTHTNTAYYSISKGIRKVSLNSIIELLSYLNLYAISTPWYFTKTLCSQINLIGDHLKFERFAALRYCFLIPRIVSLTFKQGYTRFFSLLKYTHRSSLKISSVFFVPFWDQKIWTFQSLSQVVILSHCQSIQYFVLIPFKPTERARHLDNRSSCRDHWENLDTRHPPAFDN